MDVIVLSPVGGSETVATSAHFSSRFISWRVSARSPRRRPRGRSRCGDFHV